MAIITQEYDDATVEVADQADIDAAVGQELKALGLTRAELEAQAVDDEFTSERARRLWFYVVPLDD